MIAWNTMKLFPKTNDLVMIALMLLSSSAYCQQKIIDSLQWEIHSRSGIAKYDPLISLVRLHGAANNDAVALEFAHKARQIALQTGDTGKIVQSSRIAGQLLNRLLRHKEAEDILTETLPLAKRHQLRSDQSAILNSLAVINTYFAIYDKALDLNFQALRLRQEDKDYDAVATTFNNIGVVYYKLKDYKRGLLYFKEALALRQRLNDDYERGMLLTNVSLCYAYTKDFLNAKLFADSTLAFCNRKQCKDDIRVDAYFSLGIIHFGLGKLNEAEGHFLRSYRLAGYLRNVRYQLDNIDFLSQISISRNQMSMATQYLKVAEKLISQSEPYNLEMIKIYAQFSQMYSKIGDYKNAAFYQQKYIQLKDSVYNEELTTNLMKIEADYLDRENKAKIEAQEQILSLKEEIINRQKTLNIIVSILIILVASFSILLWRNYVRKGMANAMLDEKVKQRTLKLELNRDMLRRAFIERDLLIEHTRSDIKNMLTTMEGLCALGLNDIADSTARRYIYEMERVLDNLRVNLQSLFHTKDRVSHDLYKGKML
jgi:tetratricopeptide (TPR) repeat protein